MAPRPAQPLTEMSSRNISCVVKGAGAQGWQPCHVHVPKSGILELSGPVQPCTGIALTLSFFNLTTVVCHLPKLIPGTCSQSNRPKYLRNIAYRQVFDVLGLGFRSPTTNFVTVSIQLQHQTERSRKWNSGSRNRKFNTLHNKGRHWTLPWSHFTSVHFPPSQPNFPRHISMLHSNLRLFTSKSSFTKRFPHQKSCIPSPFEPDVRPAVATHNISI